MQTCFCRQPRHALMLAYTAILSRDAMIIAYTTPYETTPDQLSYTPMGAYFLSNSLHSNERKYIFTVLKNHIQNTRSVHLHLPTASSYQKPYRGQLQHLEVNVHIIETGSWKQLPFSQWAWVRGLAIYLHSAMVLSRVNVATIILNQN